MKKKSKKTVSRLIPVEDLKDFNAPDRAGIKHLKNSDANALKSIVKEFRVTGVVSTPRITNDSRQTMDEVSKIFEEATSVAKYEKELNPDNYDADLEQYLAEKNEAEGDRSDFSPYLGEAYDNDDERPKRVI